MSRKNTKNSVKQPELDLEKWKPEVDGKFHFIFGKFASLEADVQNVRQVNGEIKNQNHNLENELQIVEEINGEIKGENEKLMKKIDLITTNINRLREGDPGEKYKRKNSIGFDVDFFATPLGLVRVLETFLNVAGAIAAFASASHSDVDFFKFLGLTGFVFCFTNVLLHLFHLDEYISMWIYLEMGFTIIWSLLYIIAASIMTQWGASYGCCGCSFAAFFGFLVTLFYITDLVILMYHRKQRMLIQEQPEVIMSNGGPQTGHDAWASNQRF